MSTMQPCRFTSAGIRDMQGLIPPVWDLQTSRVRLHFVLSTASLTAEKLATTKIKTNKTHRDLRSSEALRSVE
jgi:hypothetical protein